MTSAATNSSPIDRFIRELPKAELHVHHVGSASARIVSELAGRHPGTVPSDLEELKRFYEFRDFAHFIEVYLAVVALIRTPEDIHYLTYEIAREMATEQRLRYAELTCTPFTSVRPDLPDAGMPIEGYTEAIEAARVEAERDFGLVLRWIYDIPGEFGLPSADATLDYALGHRPEGLVGFGLGGPEAGVPRPQFQPHFEKARAAGLHSVPHAGETTGPRTVWDSLTLLGAERIGHGTSAAQDPELLRHLADTGVPLEVCPSSNVATRAVASLDEHPIRVFRDAGVVVTVNSDDPPMFGTTLSREYAVAAGLLGLDEAGLADLARAAVRASFAPDDVRRRLLSEIDDYEAAPK
jgi:aminodeoxyfutalosine deaminase